MRFRLMQIATRLLRFIAVLVAVASATVLLVRCAPGYFSNQEELDYQHAITATAQADHDRLVTGSLGQQVSKTLLALLHGDLGRSRQFDIPVYEVVEPRLGTSALLVGKAVLLGWSIAIMAASVHACRRKPRLILAAPASLALAIPCSALVTLCLAFDTGGPVLVMTVLIAARDFKYAASIIRKALFDSHVIQARAQGISIRRILCAHVLPSILPDLMAVGSLSIVAALGALVPVEVLFNFPGIGQLAWNAAMNRDLPVLLSSTLIMAAVFTTTEMALSFEKSGGHYVA